MRKIMLASLIAVAAGCGTTKSQSTDPAFAHRATAYAPPPAAPRLDSSTWVRQTESGPPSQPTSVGHGGRD